MSESAKGMRDELQQILLQRSFRFGDFTLSSGRKSSYYFDGRQTTLDGRGSYLIGQLLLQRCHEVGAEAIGGLTLGADPIVAAVAAASGATDAPIQAFIVRKEAKTHGDAGSRIAGPPLTPGMRVVIADDTTTTGNSYLQTAEAIAGTGVEIVEAVVIVDRQEGAREVLAERGITLHALFTRSDFPEQG